jgi:hypothetical protein
LIPVDLDAAANITPLGHLGKPDDIANAAYFSPATKPFTSPASGWRSMVACSSNTVDCGRQILVSLGFSYAAFLSCSAAV